MTDWPHHPRDEWVEITGYGSDPEFVRGRSGAADEVARAKAAYVDGAITIEQFERVLDEVFV